jgi:phosphohistidine phosphatase
MPAVELYLVRHAIAEDRDASRWPDDALRPLTPAGAARFAEAARGLRRIAPEVEAVLSSPYARAWQTAEILEREARWPAPEPSSALEAPRWANDAFTALGEVPELASVALVGHEPQLSMLASLLLTGDPRMWGLELKKGAVALLDCGGPPTPRTGLLRWSASPKLLRGLAR